MKKIIISMDFFISICMELIWLMLKENFFFGSLRIVNFFFVYKEFYMVEINILYGMFDK